MKGGDTTSPDDARLEQPTDALQMESMPTMPQSTATQGGPDKVAAQDLAESRRLAADPEQAATGHSDHPPIAHGQGEEW